MRKTSRFICLALLRHLSQRTRTQEAIKQDVRKRLSVLPGMRAAGHMGNHRVTVQNLEVVKVVEAENLLVVRGAVPGPSGGYVVIRKA